LRNDRDLNPINTTIAPSSASSSPEVGSSSDGRGARAEHQHDPLAVEDHAGPDSRRMRCALCASSERDAPDAQVHHDDGRQIIAIARMWMVDASGMTQSVRRMVWLIGTP
jgi:hypothetical protein